ncbi:MAG: cysteine hydrolase [Prosthecobacter sp.]|jgi:nicotinamidase-related amidase|uniref:cysteine hydrolase family protein n=1 Tax=Prosthecobacter sp. TaxID=1965333 RepID=UPI0019DE533F|nr:isochorismatase family cysteine hydrolase [Prosthecobacter sp.]MBE2282272.1 cysteine hydrolase [Prosthecobacter sp.]
MNKGHASHPAPHGCVAGQARTVLLLIDVINPFDFPEAHRLLRFARPAARRIADLKQRLAAQHVPAIYVNDNFGRWQSDFRAQVEHCLHDDCVGADIVDLLRPGPHDYFVLKPKHSAFYSTSLELLLGYLGARCLVLTGFAGNLCVLSTANDAHMRDFDLCVPQDCIASETAGLNQAASQHMQRFLRADIRPSTHRGLLRTLLEKS